MENYLTVVTEGPMGTPAYFEIEANSPDDAVNQVRAWFPNIPVKVSAIPMPRRNTLIDVAHVPGNKMFQILLTDVNVLGG